MIFYKERERWGMISDELLFYVGIVVAIIALILLIVLTLLFKLKKVKLNAQFDIEYGVETKLEIQRSNKLKK